jgi:hypothetical protein
VRYPLCALLCAGVLLAGCGDLPRPFAGHPGPTAKRLAQPPPARLAVPPPGTALLPDEATTPYAAAVAAALLRREVPAVAGPARPGDWRLALTAELRGNKVVPAFTVDDPAGHPQGTAEGAPVAAAAWSQGSPAVLGQVADAAGPSIAQLLTRIEAARRQSDPNSLLNRPPRLLVQAVTGAPGDGNTQLTRQMRRILPELGEVVQETPTDVDYTVAGEVRTAAGGAGQMRVEIQWQVSDSAGREIGRVVQLNDVPAGTLDGLWGDVALVVAQEAASGVHDVIAKQNEGPAATARPVAAKP